MEEVDILEAIRVVKDDKVMTGPCAKDNNSGNSKKLYRRTEENLTPAMKLRRDRFVRSYVIDFNGTKAALRIGIPIRSAPKQASELLREPYVQQELQKYILEVDENVLVNRNAVIAGLVREANDRGVGSSHAARVNAYSKLARILGMEIEKVQTDVNVRGGVMVVPMSETMNDWEQKAITTQAQLKHEVEQ